MNPTPRTEIIRLWAIRSMYAAVIGHIVVGGALPWIGNLSIFEVYHRGIESGFWSYAAPAPARAQQLWWISLFGPTVVCVGIWMGALVHIGNRHRSSFVWAWLMIGLIVWAPQDILISLRINAWIHVWIDIAALLTMLPPLMWLWWNDRKHPQLI
jgi:hypothetical protein